MKKQLKTLLTIFIYLLLASCSKEVQQESISISGNGITYNSATLYWYNTFPSADHFSIHIYLKDSLIAELEDKWAYKLNNLKENTTYSGHIVCTNMASNASTTALYSFTTLKNSAPENFAVNLVKITGSSTTISWLQPYDADGDSITFDLILNKQKVAENLTETLYTLNDLLPSTTYSLVIMAKDNQGNETKKLLSFKTLLKGAELEHRNGIFGGINREYGMYIPPNTVGEKLPVVIRLHGWGLTIWPFMISDYFITLAQNEKFIHVQPQGTLSKENEPRWNFYESEDDLNFINELIDTLITKHHADAERIYLVGFSNGGGMTIYLAHELEHRLAAIAPIAASTDATYTLRKPMPLCYVHGTTDDDAYRENGTPIDYDQRLKFWIENNKVNPEPIITELEDKDPYDNSTVTKFEYINPNSSGDIVFYRVNNGGHTIPGVYSPANQDINAYDEIWEFFKTRKLSDK